MPSLAITLLGTFALQINDQEVDAFATAKARGLLAYLAVEAVQPLDRGYLANLFWPDTLEASARSNLRNALSHLRKIIGDDGAKLPYLRTTRQSIQLNPDAFSAGLISVDVNVFQTHYARATYDEQVARDAIVLYRGPFFNNAPSIDSPDFETWVQLQREVHHRQMSELLMRLIEASIVVADFLQATADARRLVDHEPWNEKAHILLMKALWAQGQGGAAMQQFQVCCRQLEDSLGIEPSSEIVALYENIRDRGADIPATLFSSATNRQVTIAKLAKPDSKAIASPHNLPPRLKPFFGRKQELASITHLFSQPDCRQVTLIGPGGIGKTQLALEFARQEKRHYPDGAWFVSLAEITNSNQISSTIASSLAVQMTSSQDSETRLYQFLRDKSLLLILDNFEHLLESSIVIPKLLQQAPSVKILVTSRERLNLHLETVFDFGGLDLPKANQAEASSAVALFVDRAQRVSPSFKLTTNVKPDVIRICQIVDGMPLGIELAAVWTRVLSCERILRKLQSSIDLLTVSMPDIPIRHRCIRALFEESWKNLSLEAQEAFTQASIFRGGCDGYALQQVTNAALATMTELVDRSFLRKTNDDRFQMHELMRQFGAEKLAQSLQGAATVKKRHAYYYLSYLTAFEYDLIGNHQIKTAQKIAEDLENIRTAWQWALDYKGINLLERAAKSLFKYHYICALAHDGAAIFEQAANHLSDTGTPPTALLVRIRNYLAAFLEPLGKVEECYKLLTHNFTTAQEYHLPNEAGWALFRLAILNIWKNEDLARSQLEESRTLFQRTGDQEGLIEALIKQAYIIREVELQPAFDLVTEALRLARDLDAPLLIAISLKELCGVCANQGDYDQAQMHAEEALTLAQHLQNRLLEAEILNNLAIPVAYQEDFARSLLLLEKSVQIYQQVGLESGDALTVQENLGRLALRTADWKKAVSYFQETAAKCRRANNEFMLARCQEGLSEAWFNLGHYQQAKKALHAAIQMKDHWDAEPSRITMLQRIAQLLIVEHNFEAAAIILAYKDHHHAMQRPASELDESEMRSILERELSPEQLQQGQIDAQQLDIKPFVDKVFISP
ncbi:MAG: BTAD domain-containing putative transcriptional regulator [Chloroflexota bacterium]